jgi:hypothetical protein
MDTPATGRSGTQNHITPIKNETKATATTIWGGKFLEAELVMTGLGAGAFFSSAMLVNFL